MTSHGKRMLSLTFALLLFLRPVCGAALAVEPIATVDFIASEPAADGRFSLRMAIRNACLNGFQFVLRYDPATVRPVSAAGSETENFDAFAKQPEGTDWLNLIGTGIDSKEGLIDFSGYVSPGTSPSYGAAPVAGCLSVGPAGVTLLTFHFQKTGTGDAILELAQESDKKPYRDYLPAGAMLANADVALMTRTSFVFPPSVGGSSEAGSSGGEASALSTDDRLQDTVILQIGNYAAAVNGRLVHIYPGERSVVPFIQSRQTMVPVRFIAEALNADVTWDGTVQTVHIAYEGRTISLTIGSSEYSVDGVSATLDAPAVLVHARTFVPVQFVMEALSRSVEWDNEHQLVFIAPAECPWNPAGAAEARSIPGLRSILSPALRDFV